MGHVKLPKVIKLVKLTKFLASSSLVFKDKGLFLSVSWSLLIVLLMKCLLSDGVLEKL